MEPELNIDLLEKALLENQHSPLPVLDCAIALKLIARIRKLQSEKYALEIKLKAVRSINGQEDY